MTHEKTFPVNMTLMKAVAAAETTHGIDEQAEKVIRERGLTSVDLMYILIAHELTRPRVVVRVVSDDVAVKEALN